MAAKLVASPGLRMASTSLDDVPHRQRDVSYPETRRRDPKYDVFLVRDTRARAGY